MFKYMLQNEEDQQANFQVAAEINLQVLRQLRRHPFRQTVLYIIDRINNRRTENRQYHQNNFQISTVFKHNNKAMSTKTQLLQACLITISHQTWSSLVTYLKD